MDWITTGLYIAALVGMTAAAFIVARSPTFWVGVAMVIWRAVAPMLLKPEDPETRKRRQAVERAGGEWDHINKRERRR
mgnify:FL=1